MGEDLIDKKIYVAKLVGSDLQGNDLYKFEPLKQIDNATFVKVATEFKRGDILISTVSPGLIVIFDKMTSITAFDSIYHNNLQSRHYWDLKFFRHATKEEKQEFFDELEADGKRWNAELLAIEDIPQPKFKVGDKVMLKSGCTSKSNLTWFSCFDEYIGKELIVIDYTEEGNVRCNNCFCFAEDWLDFYAEELKKGDLAIFWDNNCSNPLIRLYDAKTHGGQKHYDNIGIDWDNAVKWDGTKEQFEKILRGGI